jgi:hypothetical protein
MRFVVLGVSAFIVLVAFTPGQLSAGVFFNRSPSPSIYTPYPTYRWGLANPSALPAPADYPDGASGYASPPVYTSPYYYGPQTGYAFPYYHTYPGSYSPSRGYTGSQGPVLPFSAPLQPAQGPAHP